MQGGHRGQLGMGCWTPLPLATLSAVKREGLTAFWDPREIHSSSELPQSPLPTSSGGPGIHFQGLRFLILFQKASCQPSQCFEIYSWPLSNIDVNCLGLLIFRFFFNKCYKHDFFYDFLNNTLFSIAYCIVRIQNKMHMTYTIRVNRLLMLLVRVLVNSGLLVVKFLRNQKLWIFDCAWGQHL